MSSNRIHSRKFVQQWAEALGIDLATTYRVVIDAKVDDALKVYVCKYGTEDMLEITPPPDLDIKVVGE